MGTTALFGVGMMGGAILEGLLASDSFNDEIVVVEKRAERTTELADVYGVKNLSDEAAAASNTILLMVKPQDMADLLDQISGFVKPGTLVISVAAGITTEFIENKLQTGVSVVRVMPNTPALVGEGMSVLSAGANCSKDALASATTIMACIGKTLIVDESLQNSVTAVSGSGPAYIFYIAEAMIAAGQKLGLSQEAAHELTVQTIVGAAAMLRDANKSPETLRQNVTSPNGTTARAIATFDEHKFREAIEAGMQACHDRSKELSEG
ncbi:MAG: pyrroline-5-carboxylate reductase [Actinobacteria bacterium]|nr:pyrroline-5-carboxylate reductase [Actinomycetota bacterium]